MPINQPAPLMANPSKAQQEICDRAFREKIFPLEGYCDDDGKRRYRRFYGQDTRTLKIPVREDIGRTVIVTRPLIGNLLVGHFGILVNPKSGKPVFLRQYYGDVVSLEEISEGSLKDIGEGSFDTVGDRYAPNGYSSSFSTMATGYPRVHTPGGVEVKGGGYGTVLYSALCLASHLDWCGVRQFKLDREGIYNGISSMPDHRSPSAEAWWSAAKVDHNLAYEIDAANPFVSKSKRIYEPCDVYEYRMLAASNMVVAWRAESGVATIREGHHEEWGYDGRGNGKRTAAANRKAVVNMNMVGITLDHFYFFRDLAEASGATSKELDGMKHRFDTRTDILWKYGTKSKCKPSAGLGGMEWSASGQTREGLSRAAEMPEEYERLAQERADLGWPFMAD